VNFQRRVHFVDPSLRVRLGNPDPQLARYPSGDLLLSVELKIFDFFLLKVSFPKKWKKYQGDQNFFVGPLKEIHDDVDHHFLHLLHSLNIDDDDDDGDAFLDGKKKKKIDV
jgi:hypothetical protein